MLDATLDASIVASVRATSPVLYATLEVLVKRGEQPDAIIRRVDRLVGARLTSHAIAVTVRWLAAQQQVQP